MPSCCEVIRYTGGLRKVRWAMRGARAVHRNDEGGARRQTTEVGIRPATATL